MKTFFHPRHPVWRAKCAIAFALLAEPAFFGTGLWQLAASGQHGPWLLWVVAFVINAYALLTAVYYQPKMRKLEITEEEGKRKREQLWLFRTVPSAATFLLAAIGLALSGSPVCKQKNVPRDEGEDGANGLYGTKRRREHRRTWMRISFWH